MQILAGYYTYKISESYAHNQYSHMNGWKCSFQIFLQILSFELRSESDNFSKTTELSSLMPQPLKALYCALKSHFDPYNNTCQIDSSVVIWIPWALGPYGRTRTWRARLSIVEMRISRHLSLYKQPLSWQLAKMPFSSSNLILSPVIDIMLRNAQHSPGIHKHVMLKATGYEWIRWVCSQDDPARRNISSLLFHKFRFVCGMPLYCSSSSLCSVRQTSHSAPPWSGSSSRPPSLSAWRGIF